MTRYFEVIRRDGPARMGRLLLERQISTPGLIGGEDIISAGSVYRYGSLEEAASAALPQDSRRLAILPYIPAALDEEPSLSLPFVQIDGPKGVVIQPFSQKIPQEADVYVIASAGVLRSGRDLVGAIARARERIPPDAALYAPAIATPAGLGLLVYLGVDLIDTTRVMADGILGRYHTVDGVSGAEDLSELPCRCRHCTMLSEDRSDRKSLIAHNVLKLEEALVSVREMIRRETVREYVERQVRVSPDQTAALRLLDQDQEYLERRTPVFRHSTLLANTAESLHRVEVTRFARRVLARYRPPRSDVLVLLPCSARKPYSASRSHQLFAQAIGQSRRHLHELILTSPLALVPRELEEVYPASSYDVPVTGHWDLEERAWLISCLEEYLERNRYSRVVAHVEGELEETLRDSGIDAVYTGGGTGRPALERLSEAVREACAGVPRVPEPRLQRFSALADYYFGKGAGELLSMGGVRIRGRELQDAGGHVLASLTPNGTLALSLEGGERLKGLGGYWVDVGELVPRGSLLAPGVIDADPQIRPGDEVLVMGDDIFGVGRARMSGWEMVQARRGVAVELRQTRPSQGRPSVL